MLDRTDANRPIVEQVLRRQRRRGGGHPGGRSHRERRRRGHPHPRRADRTRAQLQPRRRGDALRRARRRTLTLQATLGGTFPGFEGRSEFQNNLGGRLSVRRFGFPVALQHDTVLRPDDCGGPVVDLDGRVIGFNIARAGRTESYAIPTERRPRGDRRADDDRPGGDAQAEKSARDEAATPRDSAPDRRADSAPRRPEDAVQRPRRAPRRRSAAPRPPTPTKATSSSGPTSSTPTAAPDPAKWTLRARLRSQRGAAVVPAAKTPLRRRPAGDRRPPRASRQPAVRRAPAARWQDEAQSRPSTPRPACCTARQASWKYGRFEMRGRIDVRPGLWPAFWTLGDDGRWPAGGEIDVMEYYRGTLLANAAWADRARPGQVGRLAHAAGGARRRRLGRASSTCGGWTGTRTASPCRSTAACSTKSTSARRSTKPPDGDNPFHAPHYMILNLAIGGTNGGDPGEHRVPGAVRGRLRARVSEVTPCATGSGEWEAPVKLASSPPSCEVSGFPSRANATRRARNLAKAPRQDCPNVGARRPRVARPS